MKILRPEVEACFNTHGGMFELMDNHYTTTLNVTIDELEFISNEMSEEEMDLMTSPVYTFTHRRKILEIRNKYLKIYNDEISKS